MDDNKSWRDTFLRTVALLGLILVLLLGAWGIILLAFNLSSIAGSIGSSVVSLVSGTNPPSGESLTLSAPTTAVSGSQLSIAWQHKNADGQYSYSLSYSCASGLSVKAPTPAGQYQTVPCSTPFNYTNATDGMTITPVLSGKSAVATTFVVSAIRLNDGAITASASTDVTINPAVASTPSTPTGNTGGSYTTQPTTTYVAAPRVAALYGYADLAVRIISVTPTASTYYGDSSRVTVKFQIQNVGTNIAPSGWNFNALLPLNPVYTYSSQSQQALYPGDKIVYTLTFDRPLNNYNQYNQNQVCTQQYPNYNCNTTGYNSTYPPQTNPYNQNQGQYQTCYSYNGYQNVPVACTDSDGNPIYTNQNYPYNQNTYPYNQNTNPYNQNVYPNQYGSTVTITADPRNYILESNESNNTATASVGY